MKDIIVRVPDDTKVLHALIIVSGSDEYHILSTTNVAEDNLMIDFTEEGEKDE